MEKEQNGEVPRTLFAKFKRNEKNGLMGAFLISEDQNKALEWTGKREEKADKVQTAPSSSEVTFETLTAEFIRRMNGYYRLIPAVMSVMPIVSQAEVDSRIYDAVKGEGVLISKDNEFELFEIEIDRFGAVERHIESFQALREGIASIPSMFLLGMVSSYDSFLANLIRQIYLTKPELLSSSERTISFKELTEYGDITTARESIIEKGTESVLRKSHHDQFKWLEAKLGMSLTKGLELWPEFIEVCERRNLFTHTGGIVSSQYLVVCSDHGVSLSELRPGARLTVDAKYLRSSINVLTELGVKLIQVIWRKLLPDEIEQSATSLSQVGYNLIANRRYKLASRMLRFGLYDMKKHGSERIRRMMIVNYANAEKLDGRLEEALKILGEEDWSAASDKFRICVAAVKDDVASVVSLMDRVVEPEEVGMDGFREWPVFSGVRNKPEFVARFEQIFGQPFYKDKENTERAPSEGAMQEPTLAVVAPNDSGGIADG